MQPEPSRNADRAIGWVGLGSIGTQMVLRLTAGGEAVTVYARGAGLADVLGGGASQSHDYAPLAARSEVFVLCVYNDAQLSDILFANGALAALGPSATLVIHTTGSPELVREIQARAPAGVAVLDACFSGGPADAAAGRLTLMVGGDEEPLARVTPLLRHYAQHIHHVGPLGHGQMLKLLNNLLFATNLMNAAELMTLAGQQGFAPQVVAEVMASCSGASYALNLFANPAPVGAMMQAVRPYLQKDVATAMTTAGAAGLDVDLFAATADYFRTSTDSREKIK